MGAMYIIRSDRVENWENLEKVRKFCGLEYPRILD